MLFYPHCRLLTLLFTCGLWASAAVVANPLPDTIDRVRDSVVAIGTMRAVHSEGRGVPMKFLGTGFVVGNGQQVITNLHVLPSELDAEKGEVLAIFAGRGDGAKAAQATVKAEDAQHDLVLLQLEAPGLKALKLGEDQYLREGTELAFTGFPIGAVLGLYPVTHRAMVSAVTPYVIPAHSTASLTAEQVRRLRNPFDVYQLDAIAYPGSSGSPLYSTRDGRVLGVLNSIFVKESKEQVLTDPSGIAYAIPIRHVNKLIRENP